MKKKIIDHKVLNSCSLNTNEVFEWEPVVTNVQLCKFSQCGRFLAVVRYNGVVEIWNVETVHIPMQFHDPWSQVGKNAVCVDIFWSSDAKQIGAAYVSIPTSNKDGDEPPADMNSSSSIEASSDSNNNSSGLLDEMTTQPNSNTVILLWNILEQRLTTGFKLPFTASSVSLFDNDGLCIGDRLSGQVFSVCVSTGSMANITDMTSQNTPSIEILDVSTSMGIFSSSSSSRSKSRIQLPNSYFPLPHLLRVTNPSKITNDSQDDGSLLVVLETDYNNEAASAVTLSEVSGSAFHESLFSRSTTSHILKIYRREPESPNSSLCLRISLLLPTIGGNMSHCSMSSDNRYLCLATVDGWMYIVNLVLALSVSANMSNLIRVPPECLNAYYCYPVSEVKPVNAEQSGSQASSRLVSINLPPVSSSFPRLFSNVQILPQALLPESIISSQDKNTEDGNSNYHYLLIGTNSFSSTGPKPGSHPLSSKLLFCKVPAIAVSESPALATTTSSGPPDPTANTSAPSGRRIIVDKDCLVSQSNILHVVECKKYRLRRIQLRPDLAVATDGGPTARLMQKLCMGVTSQGGLYKLQYDSPFRGDFPGPMYPPAYRLIQSLQPYVEDEDELDLVKTADLRVPSHKNIGVNSALFGISRAFQWERKNKQIRDVVYNSTSTTEPSSSGVDRRMCTDSRYSFDRLPINTRVLLNAGFEYSLSQPDITKEKKQAGKDKNTKQQQKGSRKRRLTGKANTSGVDITIEAGSESGMPYTPKLTSSQSDSNIHLYSLGSSSANRDDAFSPMDLDGDLADDATAGGDYGEYDELDDFGDADDDATVSTSLSYSTLATSQTRLAVARFSPLTSFFPVPQRIVNGDVLKYLESEQKVCYFFNPCFSYHSLIQH